MKILGTILKQSSLFREAFIKRKKLWKFPQLVRILENINLKKWSSIENRIKDFFSILESDFTDPTVLENSIIFLKASTSRRSLLPIKTVCGCGKISNMTRLQRF